MSQDPVRDDAMDGFESTLIDEELEREPDEERLLP